MADHGLPENVYRELKEGESYRPIIPAETSVLEVTVRSVLFGLFMGMVFSAAAAYVALKLGQGIESAIPISILAVGFSTLLRRKSTLLENVNILAVGATSGIIVGGSVFTMPAIYILHLEAHSSFFQVFIVPLLGAALGVLFLIPFRRYFTTEMHGKLPFPEATATTEILVTGERGGKQAVVLLYSMGLGIVLDFCAVGLRAWRDVFTTAQVEVLAPLTEKVKAVFALSTTAAVMGLGYIIGLRYALVITAGSFLSTLVLVPLFAFLGTRMTEPLTAGLPLLREMPAEDIFYHYVRHIGIGGIFCAGLLSILKMSPVIVQALKAMFGRHGAQAVAAPSRLDRDIPMPWVLGGTAALAVLLWVYFRFSVLAGVERAGLLSVVSLALTTGVAFLFAAVSAWAVAMISITPISGMTMTTLILAAVVLAQMGLSGPQGMVAILLIGGVVCTCLSMTGSLVTQFKIGYWLGSTPRAIQWGNLVGAALSSAAVTACIFLFDRTYGFVASAQHPNPMAAPQANAMAAVIQSFMSSGSAPWTLYALGAVIAVILEMLGISGLAFALGMYLPIELNAPLALGAAVAWFVTKSTQDAGLSKLRNDRGTLIASGLIAGGALAGVLDGMVKMAEDQWGTTLLPDFANTGPAGNWLGLAVFAGLGAFIYWDSVKVRREP
jgi:putative OPT family oligopeptide transporter